MYMQAALSSPVGLISQYDVSEENISRARDRFVQLLGPENVVSEFDVRRAHSITRWSPAEPSQIPSLVLFPETTAEIQAILTTCSQGRIPAVGFAGGTSMPGSIAATRRGVCIDFNRMNKILAIHKEDMDVVVQPAVDWQELNAHLQAHNLFFPPDPSPGAKVGGMVGSLHAHSVAKPTKLTSFLR